MMTNDIMQMADEARLLQHCAPVFFLPTQDTNPQTIYANATVGLINTGRRRLLVTCAHVWTDFLTYRINNPDAQLGVIFTNGFTPPERIDDNSLIDFDEAYDLAVFEARPEVWEMGFKQFYSITSWPTPCVRAGDVVAFLGFTGGGRHTQDGIGIFTYSFFGLTVTDTSDRQFLLAVEKEKRSLTDNTGSPVPPIDMGGMSGSPAYVRDRKGVFRLAGFVHQGKTSDDMIFLTHARFLKPDGTLKR